MLGRHSRRRGLATVLVALVSLTAAPPDALPQTSAAPKLAVLEFKDQLDRSEASTDTARYLADQVRSRSKELLPWLSVITKENIEELLQGRSLADCEGECEVQTGRRLGADYVVSGELLAVGGEPRLNLKLHDTHTSELLKGVTVSGTDIKAIESGLRTKVDSLLDSLVTDTGQGSTERPTTGELFVSASPSDATIQIDGGSASLLGKGGQKVFTLPLGRHRVRVRKEGFQDVEREVLIQPGAPFSLKETLLVPPPPVAVKPGRAYLSIESAPQAARVFLDGADTGKDTPANFRDLAPGPHEFVLRLPLYLDKRESVALAEDLPRSVNVQLIPDFGSLEVTSTPPGATIYLDAKEKEQRTPFTFQNLATGAHRVQLSLPRHLHAEQTVVIEPGGKASFGPTLQDSWAAVTIDSEPPAASVFIDGVQKGQTPLNLELERGSYQLRFTKPLYGDQAEALVVEPGKPVTLRPVLAAHFGSLRVTVSAGGQPVDGAEILIAGQSLGPVPATVDRIPEGLVHVEVRAPLHKSWAGELRIVPGPPTLLPAELVAEYGIVAVKADQPAQVEIDGDRLGPADGRTYRVRTGSRHLTVSPAEPNHYRPFQQELLVEPLRTTSLPVTLTPRRGSLVVQSTPIGAAITVDGRRSGETPKRLDLFAGSVKLELSKEKFIDWSGEALVKENETVPVEVSMKSVDLVKYEAEHKRLFLRRVGYASGGAAVLAGGVAGILGWRSQVAGNEWATAKDYATWSSARNRANTFGTAATTTWIVAGALAVTGAVIIWTH